MSSACVDLTDCEIDRELALGDLLEIEIGDEIFTAADLRKVLSAASG